MCFVHAFQLPSIKYCLLIADGFILLFHYFLLIGEYLLFNMTFFGILKTTSMITIHMKWNRAKYVVSKNKTQNLHCINHVIDVIEFSDNKISSTHQQNMCTNIAKHFNFLTSYF